MSNTQILSKFIDDEDKLDFTPDVLFDKIINLKINCYDEASGERESFVIRSDYELVYPYSAMPTEVTNIDPLGNRYIIRRCTIKPSIKVQ